MPHHHHKITIVDDRLTTPGGIGIQPISADLDLPENFGHVLQRSVEELNDIDNIKREGALSFSLPKTPKNRYIFEKFEAVTIVDNDFKAYKIEAWVDHIVLRFDRLLVKNNSDREKEYECEIVNSEEFWIEKAAATYLSDLDFGSFEFTVANMLDNMEFNSRYQPGNDLFYLPLVDYGNGGVTIPFTGSDIDISGVTTINLPGHGLPIGTGQYFQVIISSEGTPPAPYTNNSIYLFGVVDENQLFSLIAATSVGKGQHYATLNRWDIKSIRPFFSVPGILVESFQQIGWQLKGNILTHPDVQRWWQYILGKDFYNTGGNEDFYFSLAEKLTDDAISNIGGFLLAYDTISQEAYGNVTDHNSGTVNSIVLNDTNDKLDAMITSTVIIENTNGTSITLVIDLSVFEENTPTGTELYRERETVTIADGDTETVVLELNAVLEIGNYTTVIIVPTAPSGTVNFNVKTGTYLRTQPKQYPKYIVKGSTHEMAKMIDPDITVLEAFKGFLSLGDFKIKTDFDLKTVTVFASENTEYESVEIEGFWKPISESRDVSAYIEKDSRVLTPPTDDQPRFVHLKFKDSSDDYIDKVLQPSDDNIGLYGRTIDLGERFIGNDLTIENPLYEPTAEKQTGGVIVPVLWDNEDNNESYNIKPRIVYAVGRTRQILNDNYTAYSDSAGNPTDPYTVTQSFWYFEGDYQIYVPYVSQLPQATVFSSIFPEYIPDKNIVYGTRGNDLYNSFWALDRFVRFTLPEIAFLVRMDLEGFTAESFRQRWYILYNGEPAIYRLVKLLEHQTNNGASTEAVLIPEPTFTI